MKRTMVATERLLEEFKHGVLTTVDLTLWNLVTVLSGWWPSSGSSSWCSTSWGGRWARPDRGLGPKYPALGIAGSGRPGLYWRFHSPREAQP
jgi:hypothetical protein